MKIIDANVFASWVAEGKQSHAGTATVNPNKMPGGIRLIIVSNDGEVSSTREVLASLKEISSRPKACVSLAIRNDSVVPWHVGLTGSTSCGQVWFQSVYGSEETFTVADQSYSDAHSIAGNIEEVSVDYDVGKMKKYFKLVPTKIEGKVEVHGLGNLFSAPFTISLTP